MATTCMAGAMHKNPENGFGVRAWEKCASCYMCVMACPFTACLRATALPAREIMKCTCACTAVRTVPRLPCHAVKSVPESDYDGGGGSTELCGLVVGASAAPGGTA